MGVVEREEEEAESVEKEEERVEVTDAISSSPVVSLAILMGVVLRSVRDRFETGTNLTGPVRSGLALTNTGPVRSGLV